MPLYIYKIVYRKKCTGAIDENLECKEFQLLDLMSILIDNDYHIKSVKIKGEAIEDDLQNQ